jgi:hypothetical protein
MLLHLNSELIPCACGHCKELIHSINKKGESARYIREHFNKYIFGKTGTKTRFKKGQITEWTFVKGETKPWQSHSQKGEKAPNWKCGRIIGKYIHIYDPKHHFADPKGYVLEHRLVYEAYHKCCLLSITIIHHKNGNKIDNRIENLEAMYQAEHCRLHKTKHYIFNLL